MKKITWTLLGLISFSSFGFGIGTYKPTLLDQLIMNQQIKNKLQNKNSKQEKNDPTVTCSEYFKKGKETWQRNLEKDGESLQVQGFMDKKFSSEELLSMKPRHRFITSNVRGQDKLVSKSSYASAPIFAHSYPICEKYFQEEVSVVKIDEQTCRQVKFTTEHDTQIEYYQVFCESDANIYVSYAPISNAEFIKEVELEEDCVSCR